MEFTGFERMMERLSGGSTDPSAALTISSNSASNTTDVKPPAAEVEDPPRDKRFATILMNGILCYNAEFGESVEKKINTERIQVNGDSKGLYLCLNVSTACEVGVDNMKLALTFTNGDEAKANSVGIFVGYLTASCRYIKTAVYVPFVPDTVTISCQFSEREEDTDEINFTHDVIKYILQSSTLNPGLGSLPSAFTQNHAKHLPQYKSVITKKYNSSWHKYLKANCEVFTVFHFSEEECISKGIWPYVKAHEVRVALASQKNVLEIDRRIARESEVHEHALTEYLKSVLDGLEEGMDQREVMDHIEQNSDFLYFVSPSISTLQRFLVKQRDTFVWTTHKDLPRCIGLSRGTRVSELPSPQSKPVNNIEARLKEPPAPLPPTASTPTVSSAASSALMGGVLHPPGKHAMQKAQTPTAEFPRMHVGSQW